MPEIVNLPSSSPEARSLSSGLHAPQRAPGGWDRAAINPPVLTSHIRTEPSEPQAATCEPSELKATETRDDWACKIRILLPERVFQIATEPSLEAAANCCPSGRHASQATLGQWSVGGGAFSSRVT